MNRNFHDRYPALLLVSLALAATVTFLALGKALLQTQLTM
jgi:hypothetical protein